MFLSVTYLAYHALLSITNILFMFVKIGIKETIFKICILINLNLLTRKYNFKISLVNPSLVKLNIYGYIGLTL